MVQINLRVIQLFFCSTTLDLYSVYTVMDLLGVLE